MSEEFLGDRRKALEDQFFQKENERKTKELRERLAQQQAKDQLTDSTGIKTAEILDKLAGLRGVLLYEPEPEPVAGHFLPRTEILLARFRPGSCRSPP